MTGDRLRSMAEAAAAQLVPGETLQLAARMVDIPSPSGNERALAEMVAGVMAENGLDGRCQAVDGELCNAIGRLPGSGGGAELMLFAPLDTAFAGTETADGPFLGTPMRDDQIPVARIEGKILTGLGAHNPKGHGSAAVMAAICLARAGAPLPGDVVVALAGGGMPTNLPPGDGRPGRRIGHGAGCAFLLEQGTRPDYAIVVKPGPPAWEEVGLCWFRVTVRGLLGYAGTRHVVAHANPILAAAKVIEDLEAWFAEYSEANASGTLRPQGSIGCIRAGWPEKPTFIPEVCEIYLDLRTTPLAGPAEVRRQFATAIESIRAAHAGLDIGWETILAVPASRTDRNSWIVGAAIRAWERMTGRSFVAGRDGSGATEANVIRSWGIPTARFGLPPPPEPLPRSGQFSMGEVHADSLDALVRALIDAAVDTCGRPLAELSTESERGPRC